jgi:signal transduction histidine kinase
MFWNLIRNAIKAAPEGGTITIDLDQDQRNGLRLKISDTGNDLKDKEADNFIEPDPSGYQLGAGIGMAVVRLIVDDYNGKIHIRPNRDKGTEVEIVLPKSQAKSDSKVRL